MLNQVFATRRCICIIIRSRCRCLDIILDAFFVSNNAELLIICTDKIDVLYRVKNLRRAIVRFPCIIDNRNLQLARVNLSRCLKRNLFSGCLAFVIRENRRLQVANRQFIVRIRPLPN